MPSLAAVQGIVIAPPLQKIIVTTEPQKSFALNVTNSSKAPQHLAASAVDFGTLGETGGLLFVGEDNDFAKKYGLAPWLKLSQSEVDLEPGESIALNVTVVNDSTLTPGGHYGAVLLRDARDVSPAGSPQVDLTRVVSSLIFLQKLGGEVYNMHLSSISHNGGALKLPTEAVLRFKNTGNVHVVPRGIVTLRDMRGQVISKGVINIESNIVLPEATRVLTVPLTRLSRPSIPGTYTLQVDYRYDGFDKFASKTIKLYFVNVPLAGLIGLVVLVVAAAAIIYFRRRK